jgi:D-cysteine desulfhydrase
LTLGASLHDLPATVWGVNVCDNERYFIDKVAADAQDWLRHYPNMPRVEVEPKVLDGYVGEGYGVASPAVFDLIAELAALEGLVLDPVYTGKAFQGMLAELKAGRFASCRDVVFVHAGGLFGVFPQSQGFSW